MKFKCEKCGKETNVGNLPTSLVCRDCGCFDLQFDCAISAVPIVMGDEWGKAVIVKEDEPFLGLHKNGYIWKVKVIEELPVPGNAKGLVVPLEKVKSEEQEKMDQDESQKPKDDKPVKKTGLLKAVRKLANPIAKE